jgi:hypothetical protein
MTNRFTKVVVLAAALLALGASTVSGAAAKPKKHHLTATVAARILKSANNVITSTGTLHIKGVGDGVVMIVAQPSGKGFAFAGTAYFSNGTIRFNGTNTATVNPDGSTSYAGSAKITGGTGPGKTWKGKATITGTSTKEDPAFATYTLKGTVTY